MIPGSGRSLGEGNGNPLQCSCLEDPMDRGAWWATVHRVIELDTAEGLTVLFIIGQWGLPLDSVVFVSGEVNFEGRDGEELL